VATQLTWLRIFALPDAITTKKNRWCGFENTIEIVRENEVMPTTGLERPTEIFRIHQAPPLPFSTDFPRPFRMAGMNLSPWFQEFCA
jgi:predicted DNA-binding transcriptional regulator AlpA